MRLLATGLAATGAILIAMWIEGSGGYPRHRVILDIGSFAVISVLRYMAED